MIVNKSKERMRADAEKARAQARKALIAYGRAKQEIIANDSEMNLDIKAQILLNLDRAIVLVEKCALTADEGARLISDIVSETLSAMGIDD